MTICYSASRDMSFTMNLISPQNARFPFIEGTAGPVEKCTQATAEENDAPGTWQIEVLGEDDSSATTSFEILEPAAQMEITVFQIDPMCSGAELTWLVQGDPQGTITITRSIVGRGTETTVFQGEAGEKVNGPSDLKDPVGPGTYAYTLTAINSANQSVNQALQTTIVVC